MAFSSEIKTRLGLDISGLSDGLAKSKSQLALWSNDVGKVVSKKLDFKDLFRGLIQGLGIASTEQIAQRMVEPFKESAESAQRIAEWSDKAADSTERLLRARQSDAQQLAAMEKQMTRLVEEANKPAKLGFFRGMAGGFAAQFGLTGTAAKLFSNKDANAEKAAQNAAEQNAKGLEIELQRAKIEEARFQQEQKNFRIRDDWAKANKEQLELEAKLISGRILPDERARLGVLQQVQKIRENEEKIESVLAKYPAERTKADNDNLAIAMKHREVLSAQLTEKEKILAATKEQATAEATVGQVIESNLAKWKDFKIAIGRTGREDDALEDSELARKIANLKQDVFNRSAFDFLGLGFDAGDAAAGGRVNPMLGIQGSNLRQALDEQSLRQRVRQQHSMFGEDATLMRNPGLSLDRIREIVQSTPEEQKQLKRTADGIDELMRLFKSGQARTASTVTNFPDGG
jgi:hypothetical protein